MRRQFGSKIPDLIDAKMTKRNVLAIYSAAAEAIRKDEPRFRVRYASVEEMTANGSVQVTLVGTEYPRGHKGDFSISVDRAFSVEITR